MSKSLVEQCVGLDPNFRKEFDIGMVWEGNYWNDHDIHDCCDLDWATCEILVRKIGEALRQNVVGEKQKVVFYLPKVFQLPLSILAAHRSGIVPILMDPLTTEIDDFSSIMEDFKPQLVITVDAVWQAQTLIEVKKPIENLPEMADTQLIVIRHVAPNFGVPPPRKHLPAKRPSYKTVLDLRDGRDLEWSTVMGAIDENVKSDIFQWEADDVVAILVREGSRVEVQLCELETALENAKSEIEEKKEFHNGVENIMVLDFPDDFQSFVNILTPWFCGKTLTLYEGPLDYPDSSRLAQIIGKHNVHVIIATSPLSIPNLEYLTFFNTSTLKFIISSQDHPQNIPIFQLFKKPLFLRERKQFI